MTPTRLERLVQRKARWYDPDDDGGMMKDASFMDNEDVVKLLRAEYRALRRAVGRLRKTIPAVFTDDSRVIAYRKACGDILRLLKERGR